MILHGFTWAWELCGWSSRPCNRRWSSYHRQHICILPHRITRISMSCLSLLLPFHIEDSSFLPSHNKKSIYLIYFRSRQILDRMLWTLDAFKIRFLKITSWRSISSSQQLDLSHGLLLRDDIKKIPFLSRENFNSPCFCDFDHLCQFDSCYTMQVKNGI